MINKRIASLAFTAIITCFSCNGSGSKTNTSEQAEISVMDSTSKAIKQSTDKLEDQTNKVEASLEKLDKEFSPNN